MRAHADKSLLLTIVVVLAATACQGCFAHAIDRAFNGPRPTYPSRIERQCGKKYAEKWVWLTQDGSLQYHRHNCVRLGQNPWSKSLSYVRRVRYHPCGICNAPR
jgi:hypothetical protein